MIVIIIKLISINVSLVCRCSIIITGAGIFVSKLTPLIARISIFLILLNGLLFTPATGSIFQ